MEHNQRCYQNRISLTKLRVHTEQLLVGTPHLYPFHSSSILLMSLRSSDALAKLSSSHERKLATKLYSMCGIEQSLANDDVVLAGGICSLFNPRILEALARYKDIKSYYTKGPGVPLSSSISCLLLRDMILSIETAIGNTRYYSLSNLSTLLLTSCPWFCN